MAGKIKWAVIGSGGIARRRTIPEGLIPARNAHLMAVYGPNESTNKAVAKEFGARPLATLEAVCSSEADAVYVASPVHAHREQVLACAAAGKHVLCEKPLGRTVAEAEEMVAACAGKGVQLGAGFMMRFHSQHQAAATLIREGKLGRPVFARAQLSCWYPPLDKAWRQNPALGGGGSLMDMGSHCIDLLEMFFGPARTVSCFTHRTVHGYESEDSAVVLLSFESGALATVDAFFCIPDISSKNALELYGSKGSILATGTIGQASQGTMTAYLQPDEAGYEARQARSEAGGIRIDPAPQNIYRAEIEAFSQSLLDKAVYPLNGEVGLRSQKVLEACYISAKERRVVDIERHA